MQRDKLGTSPAVWAGVDRNDGAHTERDGMSTIPPRGSEVGLVMAEVVEQAAPTCLVLEDDAVLRRLLTRHLSNRGFKVTAAQSLAEARKAVSERTFQFILSDSMLPDGSGLDFVAEIEGRHGHPAVLVMSGDKRAERVRFGAIQASTGFLLKPFTMHSLDTTLVALDGAGRLERMLRSGPDRERVERFRTRHIPELGRDVCAIAALDVLAGVTCPALLVAEDAALARLCAYALHDAGVCPEGPFTTLQGHDFEGVPEFEARLLALRESGSLFVEAVERMPMLVQSRLVSLLAEGELERKGERERLRLKCRVVLSIGAPREELVRAGKLHPELSLLLARLEVRLTGAAEVAT